MNKIDFTLAEFLNALQVVEDIIKGHPNINSVKKDSFSKPFPKGKSKQKKKKVPSNPNKVLNPFKGIGKRKKMNDPKSKEKCFQYGIEGH